MQVSMALCRFAAALTGGKYPVALVGATVYATAKDHKTIEGVMTIKKGKLRGFESYGMLCSGTELGLTEDLYPGAGYNGLLEMPADAQPGADVKAITVLMTGCLTSH
jgi:phenylalanyl-tRNA synthetase beta chain